VKNPKCDWRAVFDADFEEDTDSDEDKLQVDDETPATGPGSDKTPATGPGSDKTIDVSWDEAAIWNEAAIYISSDEDN
jgi:hypothetical protein